VLEGFLNGSAICFLLYESSFFVNLCTLLLCLLRREFLFYFSQGVRLFVFVVVVYC